jgi:histidyl-tRNA synthetase
MLLGDEEWQRGEVVVKELRTGAQQTVPLDGIVEALDRILLGETNGTESA